MFLSVTQGELDSPDVGSKLVAPYQLPYSAHTHVHIVLILSAKKNDSPRLALEFLKNQVRTIGEWPTKDSGKLMLPALRTSYSQLGLHFVFASSGLGLSSDYRFSHVVVVPTIADFSSLGLLGSLLVSSVPTAFCSKRGTDKNGNPLYGVDYSKLLPTNET